MTKASSRRTFSGLRSEVHPRGFGGRARQHLARREKVGVRHQSLIQILKTRHKDLLSLRTPARIRRRSLTHRPAKVPRQAAENRARVATVLYVENNKMVADAVRETLEMEGWRWKGGVSSRMTTGRQH